AGTGGVAAADVRVVPAGGQGRGRAGHAVADRGDPALSCSDVVQATCSSDLAAPSTECSRRTLRSGRAFSLGNTHFLKAHHRNTMATRVPMIMPLVKSENSCTNRLTLGTWRS